MSQVEDGQDRTDEDRKKKELEDRMKEL